MHCLHEGFEDEEDTVLGGHLRQASEEVPQVLILEALEEALDSGGALHRIGIPTGADQVDQCRGLVGPCMVVRLHHHITWWEGLHQEEWGWVFFI